MPRLDLRVAPVLQQSRERNLSRQVAKRELAGNAQRQIPPMRAENSIFVSTSTSSSLIVVVCLGFRAERDQGLFRNCVGLD